MAGISSREATERAEFEQVMAAHVAKLMDFAKPYVGRLSRADTAYFIEQALEEAWIQRSTFNPHKASLLTWWERCLRAAASSRKLWSLQYSTGIEWVRGADLGRG